MPEPRAARRRRHAVAVAVAVSLLAATIAWSLPPAQAASDLTEPQRLVQQTSDALQRARRLHGAELANDPGARRRLAETLLLPRIDLPRLSALVVGSAWRSATPAQRQDFVDAFAELLIVAHADALGDLGDWSLRHLPARPSGDPDRATVRTELKRQAALPIRVDFRMIREEARWRVYDLSVLGMSLAAGYRRTIGPLVREHGLGHLIRELRRSGAATR